MAKARKKVVLTDARAIRALAHPARQLVIDELYSGRVLTATECAELTGMTPSAMSYHLRALEKWGILKRAEATEDGRERPWRAAGDSLVIPASADTAGRLASRAAVQTYIDRLGQQLDEFAPDDPWRELSSIDRTRLWLTKDELADLIRAVEDLVRSYRKDRTVHDHPADAREVSTFTAIIPLGSPPRDD